ncbi:MAG: hypothetical protein NXI12_02910 [Alphaproteobacteria bacterium]|nr:hypothetical protein [Alphaproteobacteria bacterium]
MELIAQNESDPASWPAKPADLPAAADAWPAAFIWKQLETRIAWRWNARDVEWIVEGPGAFDLPLRPATISTVEVFDDATGWETVTLAATPRGGLYLPTRDAFRVTASAGDSEAPPDILLEAYRRLAVYLAELEGEPAPAGASSHMIELGGVRESTRYDPWRRARAIDMSGAGDLLRIYRRA